MKKILFGCFEMSEIMDRRKLSKALIVLKVVKMLKFDNSYKKSIFSEYRKI